MESRDIRSRLREADRASQSTRSIYHPGRVHIERLSFRLASETMPTRSLISPCGRKMHINAKFAKRLYLAPEEGVCLSGKFRNQIRDAHSNSDSVIWPCFMAQRTTLSPPPPPPSPRPGHPSRPPRLPQSSPRRQPSLAQEYRHGTSPLFHGIAIILHRTPLLRRRYQRRAFERRGFQPFAREPNDIPLGPAAPWRSK